MFALEDEIQTEYDRWLEKIGADDPYQIRGCLGISDVLRAHFMIANYFFLEGEGIGGIGPKDLNLLHSALSRQHTSLGLKYKWNDTFDLCATLVFGLIRDHPFYDANKRTALLSCLYFLAQKSYVPTISKKELEDFMVQIAERKFGNSRRYKDLCSKHHENDAMVRYISFELKKSSRKTDHREYVITYRDLNKILLQHDYVLDDPSNNHIKMYRIKKKLFSKGTVRKFVLQIGFPGWGTEVNIKALKSVRKHAKLDHLNGFDSKSFYTGVDDMTSLLAEYHENLRNLADR
ncbi:type II toxin-antitoxin system death-on-curing family toxin [Hyphomonas johnsonii]|uniref:Death-on-curing family protein n=1 Tax=Hyphomonas johnsonii MHS-2 TaxID=1280950 RepID=A0A059FNU9_9PROT|nr:type II toxin-antitoxin system death-on-curing family toxin [Hyphomonas johnsonii]KCZ92319.1 death-on-curing family protein [Hyphomonas johnsonii MHS-2]